MRVQFFGIPAAYQAIYASLIAQGLFLMGKQIGGRRCLEPRR
jgi:hypothetical protein